MTGSWLENFKAEFDGESKVMEQAAPVSLDLQYNLNVCTTRFGVYD